MRLTTALLSALFALAAASGCKQDHPECTRYVDLTIKCDDDMKAAPDGEQRQARMLMEGMCEEAYRNDTSAVSGEARQLVSQMYAELRERATCTASANSCAQYDKCTEDDTEN